MHSCNIKAIFNENWVLDDKVVYSLPFFFFLENEGYQAFLVVQKIGFHVLGIDIMFHNRK